ncbi:hypothetical protein [Membranihabitans maritimus]|uniref:hypothetical protein n=1 Tax=Membranihabitans maritimus TaxID=2904244 RepID=UPI001F2F9304|nr:hypothetical protein [Membranihabitans maritimus]
MITKIDIYEYLWMWWYREDKYYEGLTGNARQGLPDFRMFNINGGARSEKVDHFVMSFKLDMNNFVSPHRSPPAMSIGTDFIGTVSVGHVVS